HQAGDPVRAAQLILDLSELPEPPRNVALGAMAMERGTERLRRKLADIEAWRERGLATDFPAA
ncbi:MAG TPA: short-chain dehydrogenase/reductase, partial [Castellaniella sp.]|nr:short-chain dehydrogenase/reductase [Castellaniella sp.]